MSRKTTVKMMTDLVMTALLLCQMAFMLIGEIAHEWMGTVLFFLFVLHHILNGRWHRNILKGRYTGMRLLQLIVNILIFLAMVSLMVSGITMSREVFVFLPVEGGMSFARILHMLAAYWGFIFMSIHLGLHWGMIMGMMRNVTGCKKVLPSRTWGLRTLALLISGYGIFAFVKHNIADYLFLCTQFVFFNTEQPLIHFFVEYLAMMGLWVCIAYYIARLIQHFPKNNTHYLIKSK